MAEKRTFLFGVDNLFLFYRTYLSNAGPIFCRRKRTATLIAVPVFSSGAALTGGPGPASLGAETDAAALAVSVFNERPRKHHEQHPPAAFVKLLPWRWADRDLF